MHVILFSYIRLWLVYGMTEVFCLAVLVSVRHGEGLIGHKWSATAILILAVYPLVGLVLGGIHIGCARIAFLGKLAVRRKLYPADGLDAAEAVMGALFLLNAMWHRVHFAIPGAVLVLVFAFFHWGARRRPSWKRLAGLITAEGSVFLMGIWAFLLEPREFFSLGKAVCLLLLATGMVMMIIWTGRKVGRTFFPRYRKWGNTKWAPLGLTWILTLLFSLGLLPLYPNDYPTEHEAQLPAGRAILRSPRRPNILLIILDTVRADHMSLYGYSRPTTPFLERFAAAEATLYTRAYSASNYTLPSHASIFTGLYASATGAYNDSRHSKGQPIHSDLPLITKALKKTGYATMGFVANYVYLSSVYGFEKGFDRYFCRYSGFFSFRKQFFRETIKDLSGWLLGQWTYKLFLDCHEINLIAKKYEAFDFGKTSFVFLNYMDSHWPYLPNSRFYKLFVTSEIKIPWENPDFLQGRLLAKQELYQEIRHIRNLYDATIRQQDEALEDVIRILKKRGEFDNTLIVITSDHGEGLGENGVLQHCKGLGNDQVWVPLVIKYPFQKKGRIDDRPAGGVDILPTILHVADVAWPHVCHGRSLLTAPSASDAVPVVAESFAGKFRSDGKVQYSTKSFLEEILFVLPAIQAHWDPDSGIQASSAGNGASPANAVDAGLHRYVESFLRRARKWMVRKNGKKVNQEHMATFRALGYL